MVQRIQDLRQSCSLFSDLAMDFDYQGTIGKPRLLLQMLDHLLHHRTVEVTSDDHHRAVDATWHQERVDLSANFSRNLIHPRGGHHLFVRLDPCVCVQQAMFGGDHPQVHMVTREQ